MPGLSKSYSSCFRGSSSRAKRILLHDLTTTHGSKTTKKAVLELMQIELEAHSLEISSMVLERVGRMLPDHDAPPEQLDDLKMLLVQPMLLSNKQLGQILQLEELHKQIFTNEATILETTFSTFAPGPFHRLNSTLSQTSCKKGVCISPIK